MSNGMKIGWRLAVIALCALFLTASVWALVSAVSDQLEYRSWGQDMDNYEYELQRGDYGGLGQQLAWYAPEGDQFQMYWDVADAYEAYSVYSFWERVTEDTTASDEDRAAAALYGPQYLKKLQEIYDISDVTARKYMDSFAAAVLGKE